ncbi:hypothetical protein MMC18_003732 [Xylographa bjoerkii]|nr:hypothetical protein [Xylographa bjoerkii]
MTHEQQRVRAEELPYFFHQFDEIERHFYTVTQAPTDEDTANMQARMHTANMVDAMIGAAAFGRVFCLSNDKYMLLAPIGTKVGDKICVIHGLPVPFIIRPEGDMFSLVGECYVEGVMDGKVMDMEHIKTQEINLK